MRTHINPTSETIRNRASTSASGLQSESIPYRGHPSSREPSSALDTSGKSSSDDFSNDGDPLQSPTACVDGDGKLSNEDDKLPNGL